MTFFIGSNAAFGAAGVNFPSFTYTTRPANAVNGQVIYNSSSGMMEIYDQGVWKQVDNTTGGADYAFLYRQIITTSYVVGGYKDSVPWKNVNRMVHATDVCTNLGDQIAENANYTSGVCNLTKGFLWGAAAAAFNQTTTTTVAFNMATETSAGTNANWNITAARNDCGTVFKEHSFAWVIGGGPGGVDLFNLTTETMSSTGLTSITGSSDYQYGVATVSDELKGFAWADGATAKLSFATGSTLSISGGTVSGSSGQQKGINSKLRRGYAGNEGTYEAGYNLRRWDLVTEVNLGTTAKPIGNSGEENFDMGQNWQYMLGMYNGAQNNRGWRFNYVTETGYELGSGSTRTGVPGGSSGHCVWKG